MTIMELDFARRVDEQARFRVAYIGGAHWWRALIQPLCPAECAKSQTTCESSGKVAIQVVPATQAP